MGPAHAGLWRWRLGRLPIDVEVVSKVKRTALEGGYNLVGLLHEMGWNPNIRATHGTRQQRIGLDKVRVTRFGWHTRRVQAGRQHLGLGRTQLAGHYDQVTLVCTVRSNRRLGYGQYQFSVGDLLLGDRLRLLG